MKKEEYIDFQFEDFIKEHNLVLDNVQKELVIKFINDIFDIVNVNDKFFLGINGWLSWKYGCLLSEFLKKSNDYTLDEIKSNSELNRISNDIKEFENFVNKFLGFKYKEGQFIEK